MRTIDVGKFWFTKFYGEATGNDPLNGTDITLYPEKQFDFVVNMVYAGLRTWYKSQKRVEDFKKDDVQEWIGEKETDEIAEIINSYATITAPEKKETSPAAGA